jgi:hypothetical protein
MGRCIPLQPVLQNAVPEIREKRKNRLILIPASSSIGTGAGPVDSEKNKVFVFVKTLPVLSPVLLIC